MTRVLFVCEHLPNEGGIGSSLINHLNCYDRSKYDVTLCLICNYIDPSIRIPNDVKIIKGSKLMEYHIVNYDKRKNEYKKAERVLMLFFKFVRRLVGFEKYQRFALKKYKIENNFDVAISYSNDICKNGVPISGGSNYCVLNCVNADRKIAWVHSEPRTQGFTYEYCKKNFEKYDAIVNVSGGCKQLFDSMIPEYCSKSFVVYNILDEQIINKGATEECPGDIDTDKMVLVTVARMHEGQKKISRIIETVDKLKKLNYQDFNWYILGDGPNYNEYVAECEQRSISDCLHFLGRINNPYKYMANADLFVLSSDCEACPMALREALMVGCPVITTDYQASHEMVIDSVNGIICNKSTDGVFSAVKYLMDNPDKINSMREKTGECDFNNKSRLQFEAVVGGTGA